MLSIEKVATPLGENLDLEVLFVADEDGKDVKMGTPTVTGAKVVARVLEHGRSPKVSVIKYKPKVRYKRMVGHRQPFTKVKIEKIQV